MDDLRLGSKNFSFAGTRIIYVSAALIASVSMWLYVARVAIPYQIKDAAAHDHPRGNLSDLYPRWLGSRELLDHGVDPYSSRVTQEIQLGYYGRTLDPTRVGDPPDQQAFAYPVYVVFLFAPMIHLPFKVVQTVFHWFFCLVTGVSVFLWLKALEWRISKWSIVILICFTLSNVAAIQGIKLEQLSLLVAGLVALCALALSRRNFGTAGAVLALATIKPQLVLLLAAWLLLWAMSSWRYRQNFVWGFLGTMTILCVASEFILPHWTWEFIQAVKSYREYTHAKSVLERVTDARAGVILTICLLLITARVCCLLRKESEKTDYFIFMVAFLLTVTLVIIPTLSTYNQVLILPGVLMLVKQGKNLWNRNLISQIVWLAVGAALFWPWVAALGLTIASFLLPPERVQQAWALPFYTSLATPLAILGLMFQYALQLLSSRRPVPEIAKS